MIKATVINGNKTAMAELPCDKYDLYEVLHSLGIRDPSKRILLIDNEGDDIRVRLSSDSDFGNHLIRLFNARSTLGDINSMCLRLQNTREEIRDELEQNLLGDQYGEPYELTADIRELTESCGVVKVSFVCPLVGSIEDSEYDEPQTISNQRLKCFEYEIGELLESEQSEPEDEMAQYFNADDRIKEKLVSVAWKYSLKSPTEQLKFKAAAEAENPQTLDELHDIMDHLYEYELTTNPTDASDFYKQYLAHHLDSRFDTKWLDTLLTRNLSLRKTCSENYVSDSIPCARVRKANSLTDTRISMKTPSLCSVSKA